MAKRQYWSDLFTGTTWEAFLQHGADVSGFRESKRTTAKKIRPGDYFICYLTGLSRFIGVLEVCSESFFDRTMIWDTEDFPVRFKVKVVHQLKPQTAIPILELRDKLAMLQNLKTPKSWSGFFRGSPGKFKETDGEAIVQAIEEAVANPVERPYEQRKYWRHPKVYQSDKVGKVTVPEEDKEDVEVAAAEERAKPEKVTHEEIQYLLLKLGSDMGLDVWVARNDRNREFNGKRFANIPNMRTELPAQFDDATSRTIELIDVLWLQGDAILAAFEVEHMTSIYSGLLRMADLVTMQPNIRIKLYMVAPEERRDKVFDEVNRPTFAKLKPPLPKLCSFIPYSELKREIAQVGDRMRYMRPDFIDEIAESSEPEEV